jgi:hypothetical protein
MTKEEPTAQKLTNSDLNTRMYVEVTVDSSPQNEDSSSHHNNNSSNGSNSSTATKENNNTPNQTLNGQTTSQQ